jgi:hypothetical protein
MRNFRLTIQGTSVLGEVPTKMTLSVTQNNISDTLSERDFHKGHLEKKSPSFHRLWQKRFFVLENRVLKYYKTEQDYNEKRPPKGVIDF